MKSVSIYNTILAPLSTEAQRLCNFHCVSYGASGTSGSCRTQTSYHSAKFLQLLRSYTTILHYTILNWTILYYAVLYYTVLCYTMLHCNYDTIPKGMSGYIFCYTIRRCTVITILY